MVTSLFGETQVDGLGQRKLKKGTNMAKEFHFFAETKDTNGAALVLDRSCLCLRNLSYEC